MKPFKYQGARSSSPKQTSWNVNITKPSSMLLIWILNLHQNGKEYTF